MPPARDTDGPTEDAQKPARRRRRPRQTDAPAAEAPGSAAAQEADAAPPTRDTDEPTEDAQKPARRRRRPRQTDAPAAEASGSAAAQETDAAPPTRDTDEPTEDAPKPTRRRGRRSAAGRAQAQAEASPAEGTAAQESDPPQRRARTRRAAPLVTPPARGAERQGEPGTPKPRRKSGQGSDETGDVSFMHPSEQEFAKMLDYYKVPYLYEPRSFPLRWDGNRVVEMFSPDFYLPEQDQYFELTTMKQSLVTQKNRKLRQVKELYPEVNVQLLYRRDYVRLLAKYGYGPLSTAEVKGLDHVLFTEEQIQARVNDIARRIEHDYAGQSLVVVGVLRGAFVFMADLIRKVGGLPVETDFISVSRYGGGQDRHVEVMHDIDVDVTGRHVLLVEGIVDTGMSLRPIMQHVQAKRPASVEVCAMFDKRARRVIDVPLRYAGFEVPDEFVVGYGLDHDERYRNLPYLSSMEVVEPKVVPQR